MKGGDNEESGNNENDGNAEKGGDNENDGITRTARKSGEEFEPLAAVSRRPRYLRRSRYPGVLVITPFT